MMRRNFITGEWEDAPDDLSGTWVVRDGRVVRAKPKNEKSSRSTLCSKNPWMSRSVGVHPRRAAEVNATAKSMGMDFRINEKGFATATSPKGKKDAMRYFGMQNRDGGYGDVCP
jgi:hypothetical protein